MCGACKYANKISKNATVITLFFNCAFEYKWQENTSTNIYYEYLSLTPGVSELLAFFSSMFNSTFICSVKNRPFLTAKLIFQNFRFVLSLGEITFPIFEMTTISSFPQGHLEGECSESSSEKFGSPENSSSRKELAGSFL